MSVLLAAYDINSLKRDASAGPAYEFHSGTNFDWDSYEFHASTQKKVHGVGVLPQAPVYNEGADVTFRIKWRTDGTTTGTTRWRVAVVGRTHSETFDVAATDTGDIDSARTAANQELWADITLSSPSLSPGDTIQFTVTRVADHANDTYSDYASLIGVEIYT